jgi:hypothetical protein
MSDLQIGLLAVGALVVAVILAYNAVQERRARRVAERAFGSAHADVLLGGAGERHEPKFDLPARRAGIVDGGLLPDPRVDYVIELTVRQATLAAEVQARWQPFEHRFAGRALLAASGDSKDWLALAQAAQCHIIRLGLQLASRAGPVAEADLIEFRAAADTLASQVGAAVTAPEIKQALEAARELDELCADADIQVALHVVPRPGREFAAESPRAAPDGFGVSRAARGGYVLTLDVPKAADVRRGYDAMVLYARDLAAELDGEIVDDNARTLDERMLASIGAQLDTVRATLEARGIAPGSPAALRLFS